MFQEQAAIRLAKQSVLELEKQMLAGLLATYLVAHILAVGIMLAACRAASHADRRTIRPYVPPGSPGCNGPIIHYRPYIFKRRRTDDGAKSAA
jgi:hypothetical protein